MDSVTTKTWAAMLLVSQSSRPAETTSHTHTRTHRPLSTLFKRRAEASPSIGPACLGDVADRQACVGEQAGLLRRPGSRKESYKRPCSMPPPHGLSHGHPHQPTEASTPDTKHGAKRSLHGIVCDQQPSP
eukprot:56154-Eustigmatos_ZCMA.PRE.2